MPRTCAPRSRRGRRSISILKRCSRAPASFAACPTASKSSARVGDVLFVDDSISTIPESTLAALAVYAGREVTVIVGGYDRGIEYGELVETALRGAAKAMICLGDSGRRIYALARAVPSRPDHPGCAIFRADGMGTPFRSPGGSPRPAEWCCCRRPPRAMVPTGIISSAGTILPQQAGLSGRLTRGSHSHPE